LKEIARNQLGSRDLRQTLTADLEIPLSELNFDVLKHLLFLEPTGYGNPEAVFVSRNIKVKAARTVGSEGKHLKLTLEDEHGVSVDAIGFRLGHLKENLPAHVDLLYRFEANEYNGRRTLQLNLKDIKPAGTPD
jgi:single-stranded-DNA-specific exonuclease